MWSNLVDRALRATFLVALVVFLTALRLCLSVLYRPTRCRLWWPLRITLTPMECHPYHIRHMFHQQPIHTFRPQRIPMWLHQCLTMVIPTLGMDIPTVTGMVATTGMVIIIEAGGD